MTSFMSNKKALSPDIESIEHIVFLGTYNANRFKDKIHAWLPELDLSSTALVVADNASTDGSEKWLLDLCSSLGFSSQFLRNQFNYGGYGNLMMNLDKFPGAHWITTLHQDDYYASNHVQNHRQVLSKSNPNLGLVCSEAKSIDTSGREVPFPRAFWLLENQMDPVTVFLAHLKQHAFPFSGASISTQVLRKFRVPWHSTAFPDTELVMKMIAEFSVEFAEGITVEYLENPTSESHALESQQKDFGAFVALSRVFAHPTFKRICEMIPIEHRAYFYDSLIDGIQARFADTRIRALLSQAVLEIVAEHIGMDSHLAELLSVGYRDVGDHRAVEHLSILNRASNKSFDGSKGASAEKVFSWAQESKKRYLLFGLGVFPRRIRKFFAIKIMKSRFGKKIFPNWNFDWKSK